jgi:hypothetical protein
LNRSFKLYRYAQLAQTRSTPTPLQLKIQQWQEKGDAERGKKPGARKQEENQEKKS